VYAIRITGTLNDDANSNTNASINFSVDVKKDCSKDTIAINAAVADAVYYFNDGDTVYSPTWTYKFDGCPKTCSYTQTSSATGDIVTGIDAATGAVTVNTVAEATFDKVDTTITVTCAMDDNASSTAQDVFIITTRSRCWDSTVVAPAFATDTYTGVELWAD